jgi:hypothetical protein
VFDIAEVAVLARIPRDQALYGSAVKQGIAFDFKARDIEAAYGVAGPGLRVKRWCKRKARGQQNSR